jgi:tetratricopeptide (TPR) repeat protein
MTHHYDDDTLSDYALAPSLDSDREAIEQHVAACLQCRDRLAFAEELEEAFGDEETWETVDLLLSRPLRFEAARAEYLRVDRADAEAEALLAPLLKSPLRFRGAEIEANSRFHTPAVVRDLCRAAHARHEKQPQFSLSIADAACRIALQLPKSGTERRAVLALAVRERANAFRYLGRFVEGLKSLDDAEKLFDRSPGTDPFDLAIVSYIRATIYLKSGRAAEGLPLVKAAAAIFEEYGDSRRELAAVMAEAACFLYSGHPSQAAEAFERVTSMAREQDQPETLARALQNAGDAYLAASKHERATPLLMEALALFDILGLTTERTRSAWKLASARAAAGALQEAAGELDRVRTELAALGLTNDAALATLEWAEVSLAIGESGGVAERCAAIALDFESEGIVRSARIAVAYLQEALRSGAATPEIVRHVRSYLAELPNHPSAAFERPA